MQNIKLSKETGKYNVDEDDEFEDLFWFWVILDAGEIFNEWDNPEDY